jgi:hypothetical protein
MKLTQASLRTAELRKDRCSSIVSWFALIQETLSLFLENPINLRLTGRAILLCPFFLPVLFLGRTPWQRGHLGGIRLSKRSFTCAKLSVHSISSTTYPSKAYKALIFMVFTHPQSLLSSGLSLLTIMHSA